MNFVIFKQVFFFYCSCEYVLQNRGCEFVTSVTERFPELNRPVPRVSNHVETSIHVRTPQLRLERRDSVELAMDHELVTQMKELGFAEDNLRKVIERYAIHYSNHRRNIADTRR